MQELHVVVTVFKEAQALCSSGFVELLQAGDAAEIMDAQTVEQARVMLGSAPIFMPQGSIRLCI